MVRVRLLELLRSFWLHRSRWRDFIRKYRESGYFIGCLRYMGVRQQRESKLIRYLVPMLQSSRDEGCMKGCASERQWRPSKILITNYSVAKRTGTELWVCDVAKWLEAHGNIEVLIYAPILGDLAEEYGRLGVRFTNSMEEALAFSPDLVHVHHYFRKEVGRLVRRLSVNTPVLHFVHGVAPLYEEPMPYRSGVFYAGVSDLVCAKIRYVAGEDGGAHVRKVGNFSGYGEGFGPFLPRRALLLSSRFPREAFEPLKEAFSSIGIDLTWAGFDGASMLSDLKRQCGDFDIILGTGKTAIDGLCLGKRVILCEDGLLGPAVTDKNFTHLYGMNFALASESVEADVVSSGDIVFSRVQELGSIDECAMAKLTRSCHIDEVLPVLMDVYVAIHQPSSSK